jgi:hypothetical protein
MQSAAFRCSSATERSEKRPQPERPDRNAPHVALPHQRETSPTAENGYVAGASSGALWRAETSFGLPAARPILTYVIPWLHMSSGR